MGDNRVFNVNGRGREALHQTLALAFDQWGNNTSCNGYVFSEQHGLILLWSLTEKPDCTALPSEAGSILTADICWNWLQSKQAETVTIEGWDSNHDHDGHNSKGWRVYCEDWGHVDGMWQAICAVKPAYMWHGK